MTSLPHFRVHHDGPRLTEFCGEEDSSVATINVSRLNALRAGVSPVELVIHPVHCQTTCTSCDKQVSTGYDISSNNIVIIIVLL